MTAVGCRSITVVVGVIVCLIFYVTVFVLRHRLSLPLAWCSGGLVVEINNTTNGTWGAAEQPRNRSYLDVYYFDAKRVGSYGGVETLKRASHTSERFVKKWLTEQDTYTLHKPVRTTFKRRCVVVGGMHQQWQADLVDVSNLKKDNDGITFLLNVIDVFSKWAWCIPLKNKSASSLVAAFTELLSNIKPVTLQTDKGLEFRNRSFQALLKENGVHHFSTHNEETKASIVERFNRTLKTRMWRYFTKHQTVRYLEKLRDFVWSYNNTYHRSLGMAPSMVNDVNQEAVWQRLCGRDGGGKPKFVVGDRVRISKAKRQFKRGTWLG